jgi:hypothetical protein
VLLAVFALRRFTTAPVQANSAVGAAEEDSLVLMRMSLLSSSLAWSSPCSLRILALGQGRFRRQSTSSLPQILVLFGLGTLLTREAAKSEAAP